MQAFRLHEKATDDASDQICMVAVGRLCLGCGCGGGGGT